MSTENTDQAKQTYDPAMETFYKFLPEEEVKGESPDAPAEPEGKENEEGATDASAQAEGESTDSGQGEGVNGSGEDEGNQEQTFDLNRYFEESSEGLLKTEEDFKTSISKIKDYDELKAKLSALQSDQENLFANDGIKKLNSLYKAGKSQAQIDQYMELSKIDLDTIDPREALVMDKVLNHGYSRKVAERLVDKDFRLNDYPTEGEDLTEEEISNNKAEVEVIQEMMKKQSKEVVEGFRKDIEDLNKLDSPETKALEEAAKRKAYEKALEPFTEQLVRDFPKQVKFSPAEGVELSYDVPAEVIDSIKSEATAYFNHPDIEVNNDTVGEFLTLKKALFVYSKLPEIMKSSFEQGESIGVKKTTEKFENPNGLDRRDVSVDVSAENIDEILLGLSKQ